MSNQPPPTSRQTEPTTELLELHSMLENIDRGFMTLDRNWFIVYINARAAHDVGRKPDELFGKNLWAEFPELEGTSSAECYRRAMDGRVAVEFEEQGVLTGRWNQQKAYPTVNGIVIAWADITDRKKTEAELEDSKKRLQTILDAMNDGIVLLGMDGKVTYCNQATLKQFQMKREEVIGKVITDFMFSENKEDFIRETRDALRKTGKAIVETKLQRKNDSPLPVEVSLTRFYDQNRRPTGLLGVARDITERKKIQDGLRESEERFSKAFHNNPAAMAISSMDGHIVNVNESFERLMGYGKDEVIGKIGCDIGLYDPIEQVELVRQLKEKGKVSNAEMNFRQKSGNQVNVLFSLEPITLNKESYSLGIAIDNTERKKAEEALAIAQEILKRQLDEIKFYYDVAPVGLSVFDTNLRFIKVNKQMAEINGIPPEDHVGKSIAEVVPSVAEPLEKLLKQIISSGNPIQNLEVTGEATNMPGIKRTLLENFVPMKDSKGFVIGVNVVAQEITEQKIMQAKLQEYSKNLEQLVEQRTKQLQDKERLAAIGATAGMVGHDIRNPLQAIISNIYLLKSDLSTMPEGKMKDGVKESFDDIENNILYVNKIVADLQDYARPLKPEYANVDLSEVATNVVKGAHVPDNITVDISSNTFQKIRSEPTFIRRILANLVNNAIQAMPNGGNLELTSLVQEDNVYVTVADTGEGIPEEFKPKLFTPMVTTKSKGQGLGLAVVKRLVEALNGTVTFESQLGKGTKFIIELPVS